jgi:localization factor PodJL
MRPDLPWSVAGISSEAREAARAAARREGLSVGEWLTRRIDSELADMSEPRTQWSFRNEPRREPERARIRLDDKLADEMLEHVARSETETAETYRRIEEQLKSLTRRLDASERSQTENSRVMSKAAVEMNIAAREQSQAFDQLGAHVINLADRLEQVEGRENSDGLRDAVKALHQGLSRLADQIAQTANQSAAQISNLAGNLETVAGRVGQARQDATAAAQALEGRLNAIDERVHAVETAGQAHAGAIDRALNAIEDQRRQPSPMEAIVRLEDSVRRLEDRGPDPSIDRRLGGIERTLSEVVDRIESRDDPAQGLEDTIRRVMVRLEGLEAAQREAAAEIRKAATRVVEEPAAPPPVAAPVPPPPAPAAPPPAAPAAAFGAFEPPPFAMDAPPLAAEAPPFAAAPPPLTAAAPPFAAPFAAAPSEALPNNYELPPDPGALETGLTGEAALAAEAPTTVESYLAAARRSARAAAAQEAERGATLGALRWGSHAKPEDAAPKKKASPLLVGLAVLIALLVCIALFFRWQNANQASPAAATAPAAAIAPKTKVAVKTPPAPVNTNLAEGQAPALPPVPRAVKPVAAAKPAPVTHPVQTAALPPAVRPAAVAPLDRLTQAANAGNARAQLIVGIKYLDGDGVPVNESEAAKWLAKAAEANEPVAQYRLGTLFERGRGVAADPVKAVRWYLAAANQGSRKAMHNLAVAYAEGSGVKKDYAEASRWFLRAANLGLSDSQFNLAVLYERGLGVPQNLVDAYKWYAIAAAQGDGESKTRIGAIASQLEPDAKAAAQHAADAFKPGVLNARANVAPTVGDVIRG